MEQSRYIYTHIEKSKHFLKKYPLLVAHTIVSTAKVLNILRLVLSHLCDHKFNYGFLDFLNSICSCGLDIETTCHYLLVIIYSIAPILQIKEEFS